MILKMYVIVPYWNSGASDFTLNWAFSAAFFAASQADALVRFVPSAPGCASTTVPSLFTLIDTTTFPDSCTLYVGLGSAPITDRPASFAFGAPVWFPSFMFPDACPASSLSLGCDDV